MRFKKEFHDKLYMLSIAIGRALEADYLNMAETPDAYLLRINDAYHYLNDLKDVDSIFEDK